MLFAALVAGVGRGVVETEPFADAGDVGFADACIGRVDLYPDVGAVPHGLRHGMHESRAAIGIDRMVAAVIGDEYLAQLSAFGKPAGHGKHDAIAERHDGRFHVFGLIVALRYGIPALQKRGLEILTDECERDDDMFDAELLAMPRGTLGLALIVVAPIVERYGQCDFLGLFMQEGDAIHASRYDDDRIFHILVAF